MIQRLNEVIAENSDQVGSKSWHLAQLLQLGFPIPPGICITIDAYKKFVADNALFTNINNELNRKDINTMRWEELWDASFRIRVAFLNAKLTPSFSESVQTALQNANISYPLSVRSSAPGEDTLNLSFAGLHETILDCDDLDATLTAIKLVWASLWSEAALMYRREMTLSVENSAMAILIQPMIHHPIAGIAFSQDPRQKDSKQMIIETVTGRLDQLVAHLVEPDHYELNKQNLQIEKTILASQKTSAALTNEEVTFIASQCLRIEETLKFPVDVEWSGLMDDFTILQARPITALTESVKDGREYFLKLTMSQDELEKLCDSVATDILPRLKICGEEWAAQNLYHLTSQELSKIILLRERVLGEWKSIYKFKLVPIAHAVRELGEFYQRHVAPEDPYEFIYLLLNQERAATSRDEILLNLAHQVRNDNQLHAALIQLSSQWQAKKFYWPEAVKNLEPFESGKNFLKVVKNLCQSHFDVNFHTERLSEHPEILLHVILGLADFPKHYDKTNARALYEQKLLSKTPEEKKSHAQSLLKLARISWQLRDDDDLLLGRLESQLLHAVSVGLQSLQAQAKILFLPKPSITLAKAVAEILGRGELKPVKFISNSEEKPRENLHQKKYAEGKLHGQPASPGVVVGQLRKILHADDLKHFQPGEILACEFIDPVMTSIIPLSAGIIESRGGMLIHSVIIARELGLPCVNGISNMLSNIENGQWVEVNGTLGTVTFLEDPNE